jgi:sterol desaturase/sphingolipid hydroxylase (fatty acid hydroxylase superfamily)
MSNAADAPAKSHSDSPRIFESDFLDRFSRIDHRVPLLVYGPVVAALAAWSFATAGGVATLAGAFAGYVVWTLVEYFGHRFVFHWEIPGALGARAHFLIHGVHHIYPSDPLRLVMPLLMSAPILALAALPILGFGGETRFALLAGFVAGYVAYDMVHFHVHHGEARTAWGRWLKRSHMLHHFRDPERGYGVSAPWWDYVFGTAR